MNEKRFTQKDEDDWEIFDRGEHFAYAHSGYNAEKIIDELNELVDSNRELFNKNEKLEHKLQKVHESLVKENEQLKTLINNISAQRDEFYHGARENANRVGNLEKENEQLKHLIKQVLETTPIEHTLAMDLKNSIRELYDGDVE